MNSLRLSHACPLLVGFVLAGIAGCGPSGPRTYPVTGTVMYQGAAVEDATVTFSAIEGNANAVGRTDAAGRYALTTFERNDGAVLGEYKVRVFKYEAPSRTEAAAVVPDDQYVEPPLQETPPPPPKHLLPEVYASPARTPLSFTVQDGENVFDITIE